MENELPLVEPKPISGSCCRLNPLTIGILIGLGIATIWGIGFAIGRGTSKSTSWNGIPIEKVPPELLRASATHGSANMAVCTGQIDNDSEGFFALDFLTGDLKCWVYYPRQAAFGGMFYTNVMPQLGPISKNPEYLLVTGGASPAAVGSILRPAECLVYVVDARNGFFAAYTIPWNRTAESSFSSQAGPIVFVGGGKIREPQGGGRKLTPPPAGAAGAGANNPNNPNNPANPNKPAGVGAPAGGAANQNPNAGIDPFAPPGNNPPGNKKP